jgi:hypothetical protein
MFAACGTIIMSNEPPLARFPVFPVEPGIFSICYPQPLFGPKNGKENRALASEFP